MIELDSRPGFYAKVDWANVAAKLQAAYYDHRGDPEATPHATTARASAWRPPSAKRQCRPRCG